MFIDKSEYEFLFKKIRIITAVREPISQNVSTIYQFLSMCGSEYQPFLSVLMMVLKNIDKESLDEIKSIMINDGGDIQQIFDMFVDKNKNTKIYGTSRHAIQNFIPDFCENIIDITAYPFDKEKGYTIIKEDNIEIFVYQLEKLNNIIPELSAWVGVPFDSLEIDNVASSKWTGESYKQAQKEIRFSKEYFDRCYNEKYVKHFYSDSDIEKFKNKWKGNVK